MKVNEIRNLTTDEITRKISELKGELFNLRFQMATGHIDNPMRIKEVRKSIARAKTIIKEREIKKA
jgi:large subunit ribosomal protein L29